MGRSRAKRDAEPSSGDAEGANGRPKRAKKPLKHFGDESDAEEITAAAAAEKPR
jgi:hypothetical protein